METIRRSPLALPVLFIVTLTFHSAQAVKFPNDVDGQPEIECGDATVRISVKTANGVASRLYAKGHYIDNSCTFEKTNSGSFNIGSCGMNRQRQLEPRGISYGLVVVVQLHPMFVTKVDRAYSIRCFYMEAEKTVTSLLDVSMISTQAITGGAPMPVCNYELHAESPNGPSVRYARVGDKVWHTWTCPSPTYGILVHSCVVTDGQGNDFKVIDEKGCGMDQYVLRTPEYSTDLTRVQQETHVFKFADKTAVMFNCQIKLCQKADNGCEGTSPPTCPNSPASTSPSEQIISEPPNSNATEIPTANRTSISDSEATTSTARAVTASVKVLDNENTTVSQTNDTLNASFPTPRNFPPLTSGNFFINNTMISDGDEKMPIFGNESTSNSTILPQGQVAENVTEIASTNRTIEIGDTTTATTIPDIDNRSNATFDNITNIASFENATSIYRTTPSYNVTRIEIDISNSSVFGNETSFSQINETKSNLFNLTTSEGFLLLSKSGHRNLSWARETQDGVTEIYSGEGSGYWEGVDRENDSSADWNLQQNRSANFSTTTSKTSTTEPLALANATIIVVGSSDDGRGRRNVLSPLLTRTADELISRDEDRRFRDQTYERLPDIETDVSQLMWVLEPEEGNVKDGHDRGSDSGKRVHVDDSLKSLIEHDDEWSDEKQQWANNGRVCLSTRTMLAILMPLLAIMLLTIAAVVLCLRRLRAESKLTHLRQSFPLNYLYKNP